MATTNLGKIVMVNRGEWSASASYTPLDVVTLNNSHALYVCKVANTNVNPSTDASKWTLWIQSSDAYTKTETDTLLGGKISSTEKGSNNGVAELDSTGKVPSNQLPSFVDDVEEYANRSSFPTTGESGKIYIALDTNLAYRWGGTDYVEISPSLALGETSSTAYRGDRGVVAYNHSQMTSGNPHNVSMSDLSISHETWTFTLDDNSTLTREVVFYNA